jgi:hypothetical protein
MDKSLFLVGSNIIKKKTLEPFDNKLCDFFDCLSRQIFKEKKKFENTDILTLGFWFRRKNIIKFKEKFIDNELKLPVGIVFHITPNNVPINFAYSLFFGLITGNTNVVKVPSKNYFQIEYLCKMIKNLLKIKKFKNLSPMINILRYNNNDKITEEISKISNARLIWGGDQTVKNLKKISTPSKCIDITFPDRYSFSIINLNSLQNLDSHEFKNTIKKFYTDNYTFDQNACNSAHLVFWYGKKRNNIIINKFWLELKKYVDEKIDYPDSVSTEKFNKLCKDLIKFGNIKKLDKFSKELHVVSLKRLNTNNEMQRGQWGYFYQYFSKDMSVLKNIINEKYQTLSYFGFEKKQIKKFIQKNQIRGIDRVVPLGRSMEMSYLWDGYNLFKALTRIIDIK